MEMKEEGIMMPKTPRIKPTFTRAELQLLYIGLGFWRSGRIDAPQADIEKLCKKLVKLGAKAA